MDRFSLCGVLAAVFAGVSIAFYIRAILRGESKPNRVSWWIWAALGLLIFLSYVKSGGTTLWLQAMFTLNPLMIAVLSIWYGEGTWLTRLDKTVLGIAAVSIPLWAMMRFVFGDVPQAALPILLLNLFGDFIGGIPTFVKIWKRPETEDPKAWILCAIGTILNLFAVRSWGSSDIVWNGYMTTIAVYFALAACFRPHSVPATRNG